MNTYLGQRKSFYLFALLLPGPESRFFRDQKPFESEHQFKEAGLLELRLANLILRRTPGRVLVAIVSSS